MGKRPCAFTTLLTLAKDTSVTHPLRSLILMPPRRVLHLSVTSLGDPMSSMVSLTLDVMFTSTAMSSKPRRLHRGKQRPSEQQPLPGCQEPAVPWGHSCNPTYHLAFRATRV